MTYNYVEYLQARLIEAQGDKKPKRTELQIEIATASLLNERGYHAISIDLITERAKMAHGTFYRYFAGKREAVAKTIESYFDFVKATRPRIHGISDQEAVKLGNRHYVRCFRENVGIMRCLFQLKDEDDGIAEVGRRADRVMSDRIIARLERLHAIPAGARPELRLRTYALTGMVDELLLKVYGRVDPPLGEFADEPDLVADTLTQLWNSALHDMRQL